MLLKLTADDNDLNNIFFVLLDYNIYVMIFILLMGKFA